MACQGRGEAIITDSAGKIATPVANFLAADEPRFSSAGGADPAPSGNGIVPVPGTGTTSTGVYPSAANGVELANGAGPFSPAGTQVSNDRSSTILNAKAMAPNSELGALSEQFESSDDPGAIGRNFQVTDGYAYGSYQMISKGKDGGTFGNYYRFLESEHPDVHAELEAAGGLDAAVRGDPTFQRKYSELMRTNPAAAATQHEYIQATHYEPQRQRIISKTGIDVATRSKTLQDVVWSTAVQQNNQTSTVMQRAINRTGKTTATVSDRELIAAIYDERGEGGGTRYFPTLTAAGKFPPVANRFDKERAQALANYDAERAALPSLTP